jgi:predicted RNA-binding Zn ribbon-like protein
MRTLEKLELVGGELCLDFANTLNSRRQPEHDYLADYPDLVAWCRKLGVLGAGETEALLERAASQPRIARASLKDAHAKRDLVYRVFASLAAESAAKPEDLRALRTAYSAALGHSEFTRQGDRFETRWTFSSLDAPLWPVMHSAGQLLLSPELAQVKECPNCGWLFVDRSKNQTRRWCSMNTCGARDKMRRYHSRKRAEG